MKCCNRGSNIKIYGCNVLTDTVYAQLMMQVSFEICSDDLLFECQRSLKDRITLLAVGDQHIIPPPPKTPYPLLVAFCSFFCHQIEGEPCEDMSTWCREHYYCAKCQVAVSLPCRAFLFQKSLQTLSQFHQKVSSDSYFLFKRKELFCIAMNFWL